MAQPLGYIGTKDISQIIQKIRVITFKGKFIVQARLPIYRGFFKGWYGVDDNGDIRDSPTFNVDRWNDLANANIFAKELMVRVSKKKQMFDDLEKDGRVMSELKIKTLKDDPDFFV